MPVSIAAISSNNSLMKLVSDTLLLEIGDIFKLGGQLGYDRLFLVDKQAYCLN
jgi:hypothetical protein